MSAQHTPGPWLWYGDNLLCGAGSDVLNAADDGKPWGHHSALIEHHFDAEVKEANKRLIAAAPELLEALKTCYDLGIDKHLVPMVKAVIAKATGAAS
jgi:hypothetical protein